MLLELDADEQQVGTEPMGGNAKVLSSTRIEDTPGAESPNIYKPKVASACVKLYDLPTFSGTPEEWPLFIASYQDSTAEFEYSNRQNLMRLHKCLIGQARDIVAAMLIYPNDIPKVIEKLEFRFGRSELLVHSQLNKIKQVPVITEARIDQVVGFSTKVRSIVAFLSSAKCENHLANPMLMEQLVSKLPITKQLDWIKHSSIIKPYPTISDFSAWLSDLARTVCCIPSTNKNVSNIAARNMHIQQKYGVICSYCEGEHILTNCNKFNDLDNKAKWGVVKEKKLCFACLKRGHNSRMCHNNRKCNINGCKFQHNRLLHDQSQESMRNHEENITTHKVLS